MGSRALLNRLQFESRKRFDYYFCGIQFLCLFPVLCVSFHGVRRVSLTLDGGKDSTGYEKHTLFPPFPHFFRFLDFALAVIYWCDFPAFSIRSIVSTTINISTLNSTTKEPTTDTTIYHRPPNCSSSGDHHQAFMSFREISVQKWQMHWYEMAVWQLRRLQRHVRWTKLSLPQQPNDLC